MTEEDRTTSPGKGLIPGLSAQTAKKNAKSRLSPAETVRYIARNALQSEKHEVHLTQTVITAGITGIIRVTGLKKEIFTGNAILVSHALKKRKNPLKRRNHSLRAEKNGKNRRSDSTLSNMKKIYYIIGSIVVVLGIISFVFFIKTSFPQISFLGAVFSPDATSLTIGSGTSNLCRGIHRVEPNGSNMRFLTIPDNDYFDAYPSYSHDKTKIVFNRTHRIKHISHIFLISGDGRHEFQVTKGDFFDAKPVFSADNKRIYFSRSSSKSYFSKETIYSVATDGTLLRKESRPDYLRLLKSLSYSPNGKFMIFATNGDIYAEEVSTGKRHKIAEVKAGHSRNFSFSSNGEQVVFVSGDPYEIARIWLMNADGSNLRDISKIIEVSLKKKLRSSPQKR